MRANLENTAAATGLEKVSFHSSPKERQSQRMLKLLHNCTDSQACKVMLKILQARLQQYMNHDLPDVQPDLEKVEKPEIKLPTSIGDVKQESSRKNIYFCFIDYNKAFDCVDLNKLWKILKEMEHQTTLPVSWENCMQVKKQQLELDMEQQTDSKSGKEYVKAVHCPPTLLT